jgi:predicted ferric reductase
MSSQVWWYVTRSTGLVSWGLVSAAVIWGLAVSTRVMAGRPTPAWLLDLHRFLGGLAVAFTGLHLASLVADSYTHFAVAELLVPLRSTWRPLAVAWGVLALYLLVAIELTSLAQRRLPRRLWRRVHGTSLVLFVLTTVHAFAAGSEAGNRLLRWIALAVATAVLFLVIYRSLVPRHAAAASSRASTQTARQTRPHPVAEPNPAHGRVHRHAATASTRPLLRPDRVLYPSRGEGDPPAGQPANPPPTSSARPDPW